MLKVWERPLGKRGTHWFASDGEINLNLATHAEGEEMEAIPDDITEIELLAMGFKPCEDEQGIKWIAVIFAQATGVDFQEILGTMTLRQTPPDALRGLTEGRSQ